MRVDRLVAGALRVPLIRAFSGPASVLGTPLLSQVWTPAGPLADQHAKKSSDAARLLAANRVQAEASVRDLAAQLVIADLKSSDEAMAHALFELPVEERALIARPSAIFVCAHNAGLSQMSAAFAHVLSDGQLLALSAGNAPSHTIYHLVTEVMEEVGIDMRNAYPKPLVPDIVHSVACAVTMGCTGASACPVPPDTRHEHWSVHEPQSWSDSGAVRLIRDQIQARVKSLVDELLL